MIKNNLFSCLKGNECRSLLKNVDKLDALLPGEHYKYRAPDAVVSSCFSYELDPCYQRYIDDFKNAWIDLKLLITCKAHLLFEHLPEELERNGFGTALWNESAGYGAQVTENLLIRSHPPYGGRGLIKK